MCVPGMMAGLNFIVGAMSSVMQFVGQQQAYNAQVDEYNRNAENARVAAINQWEQTQTRAKQEGAAATQQQFEANIATAKAVGTAQTAAGEGNVSGLSVDYLVHDIYAQKGRNADAVSTNLQMTRDYLSGEMKAARATAQNQVNSVPIPEPPSFGATLLNIFGTGIKTFGAHQQAAA